MLLGDKHEALPEPRLTPTRLTVREVTRQVIVTAESDYILAGVPLDCQLTGVH